MEPAGCLCLRAPVQGMISIAAAQNFFTTIVRMKLVWSHWTILWAWTGVGLNQLKLREEAIVSQQFNFNECEVCQVIVDNIVLNASLPKIGHSRC